MNTRSLTVPLGGMLLALMFPAGCSKPRELPKAVLPTVTVSVPSTEPVADSIDLTGTFTASRSVDLVARVAGYLESADFKEGEWVEAGKLLFVIEPKAYEEQLRLAEAALARAQAEYDRQQGLKKENATSDAAVERWLSERDQAQAQVELAKLNLGYTQVKAPFSGRIGRRLVDPGNLVGPSANSRLATLDQIVPIYVYFNLNERDALEIRDRTRQQGMQRPAQVPVFVGLQSEQGCPHEGTLDFVGTGVSTTSGTIQMRAELKNGDKNFFPGLFARVRIPLSQPQPMLVVPRSSLGNDQEGDYVLVVADDDIVVRRGVVKGPQTAKGCAIRSGLKAEDRVIINGLMNAKQGTKVTVVKGGATASEARDDRKAERGKAALHGSEKSANGEKGLLSPALSSRGGEADESEFRDLG